MRNIRVVLAMAVIALPFTLSGQQGLKFEAASIRQTEFPDAAFAAGYRQGAGECNGGQYKLSGTLVSLTKASICDVIRRAYGVKSYQVVNMPRKLGYGAAESAGGTIQEKVAAASQEPNLFYDIEARGPGAEPLDEEKAMAMLRDLLADRFHLTLHREKRELSFLALVQAKGGTKMKAAVDGCNPRGSMSVMAACGQTMDNIARSFASNTGGIVIDMTGLTEKYDYRFPIDRGDGDFRAAMVAAMQEHLGLRLEQRKGPVEVLVVDRVEAPSGN